MKTEIVKYQDDKQGIFNFYINDAIFLHLQEGHIWENHFIDLVNIMIEPGDFCIDCGAHVGLSTMAMYKAGAGIVYSYEPNKHLYKLLVSNCAENFNSTIYCRNNAVGDEATKVKMSDDRMTGNWINYGNNSTLKDTTGDIDMIKLDDEDLSDISFIKLDCQGSELKELKGAERLILRNFPVIFIEIEEPQLNKFNTTGTDVIDYLHLLGYKIYKIKTEPFTDCVAIHDLDIKSMKKIQKYKYELEII